MLYSDIEDSEVGNSLVLVGITKAETILFIVTGILIIIMTITILI